MSWDVPEGWSSKKIDKELGRVANDFESKVERGEILSKREEKEKAAAEKAAAENDRTVKQYIEEVYMPEKSVAFAENTRDSYSRNFACHIIPVIGDVLIKDVTTQQLRSLLVDFQASGKSHASCIKLYNILNSLFDYAETGGAIPFNPVSKKIRPKASKDEDTEPESENAMSASELNYVLDCVQKEPLKWQAYINLVADTGLRRGEACGIQWEDVDFDRKEVRIVRNAQYSKSKGVYVTTIKNKQKRTVDIGDQTVELLKRLQKSEESKKSQWVFTRRGSPDVMFPTSPTQYFHKFGDRYHIEDFHPHMLRHTSASIAITHGADVASVADRLGHKDKSVTLRMYTHANAESRRSAGQTVRNALAEDRASKMGDQG